MFDCSNWQNGWILNKLCAYCRTFQIRSLRNFKGLEKVFCLIDSAPLHKRNSRLTCAMVPTTVIHCWRLWNPTWYFRHDFEQNAVFVDTLEECEAWNAHFWKLTADFFRVAFLRFRGWFCFNKCPKHNSVSNFSFAKPKMCASVAISRCNFISLETPSARQFIRMFSYHQAKHIDSMDCWNLNFQMLEVFKCKKWSIISRQPKTMGRNLATHL